MNDINQRLVDGLMNEPEVQTVHLVVQLVALGTGQLLPGWLTDAMAKAAVDAVIRRCDVSRDVPRTWPLTGLFSPHEE